MCAASNFNQFQPDPDNEEITNLQKHVASLEKRLDELQKSTSTSDDSIKIHSLQADINNLQKNIDNASRSGRKDIKALSEQFNQVKSLATKQMEELLKKINSLDNNLQLNTNNDNISDCFMHLDAHRCQAAAEIADRMPIDIVGKIITQYCSSDNQYKADRKEILSKFVRYMKDNGRRSSCESLLNTMLPSPQKNDNQPLFEGGTLLSNREHQLKLNEFYGKHNQKWDLVYKGTKHGFGSTAFHEQCDGQAPTMIIIESKVGKYLFGGFTQLPWSHNRGFKQDTHSFLFTLTNPHKLSPTKFHINKSKSDNAVYHPGAGYLGELYDFYLFGFGGKGLDFLNFIERADDLLSYRRGDLFIASNCNTNKCSSTVFPWSYIDTAGFGDKTFTGTTFFIVNEIEVYTSK